MSKRKFSKFFIQGLHCPSCEILIEKKLRKIDGIFDADVSLSQQTLQVEHSTNLKITLDYLNSLFTPNGYSFSVSKFKIQNSKLPQCPIEAANPLTSNSFFPFFLGGLLIIAFILLNQTGLTALVSISSHSTLPAFFLFGLLAGFSSCAALVGGIILSVSKQWVSNFSPSDSFLHKSQPHLLFNLGRIIGYSFFGAILGIVGNFFRFSPVVTAAMVILVSLLMVLFALQMLGVKALANFQVRLPKSLTGKIADESNFQGRFAPALMGALTFFLPCGFTITAQALALASGSTITGAMIMGLFALGTAPGLLAIGLSSVKLYSNTSTSKQFSQIAGILVLFFALFNINSQLSVLGVSNLSDVFANSVPSSVKPARRGGNLESSVDSGLPEIVDGKQILKMDASSSGYTPNRLKVRSGIPIRWEITDKGTSGCTNAVISRNLFEGQIDLVPGTTSIKEFTVASPGVYKFSCWMGMVNGVLEVVDATGSTGLTPDAQAVAVGNPSSGGCGCGGGSACGAKR